MQRPLASGSPVRETEAAHLFCVTGAVLAEMRTRCIECLQSSRAGVALLLIGTKNVGASLKMQGEMRVQTEGICMY